MRFWPSFKAIIHNYRAISRQYRAHVQDQHSRAGILHFIEHALGAMIHDDRIGVARPLGSLYRDYPISDLLDRLISLAVVWGTKLAARQFVSATFHQPFHYQQMAKLEGVQLESDVQVFNGITLIPLPKSSTDFPYYLNGKLDYDMEMLDFWGSTLLVVDYKVKPRFVNPTEAAALNAPGSHSPNGTVASLDAPSFDAMEFCRALSLVCRSDVFPSVRWQTVSPRDISDLGGPSGVTRSLPMAVRPQAPCSSTQVGEARDLYVAMMNLSEAARVKLETPISRCVASLGPKPLVDKAIDLGIAYESLFLPEISDELRFRLGLRVAWLLGVDRDKRAALLADVMSFYDMRSKAVHNGTLPKQAKIGKDRVNPSRLIDRAQDLCVQSIRRIIYEGYPDWNSIILG